jgi:lipopolysaccharide/colanic/teichoic acid biosynthesis glycosyltransferase
MTRIFSDVAVLPIHNRPFARIAKRAIDFGIAGCMMIALSPLLLVIALAVALDLRSSPLFFQVRVGLGQRLFRIVKFRSMRNKPDAGAPKWDAAERARVTRLGGFLRDFGIDELPQLWNIIVGDMSIIGPRPPIESELEWYPEEALVAFEMRPGVLSLAALRGRRSIPLVERFQLHAQYVREWSPALDWRILVGVTRIVLLRQDAVERERLRGD